MAWRRVVQVTNRQIAVLDRATLLLGRVCFLEEDVVLLVCILDSLDKVTGNIIGRGEATGIPNNLTPKIIMARPFVSREFILCKSLCINKNI